MRDDDGADAGGRGTGGSTSSLTGGGGEGGGATGPCAALTIDPVVDLYPNETVDIELGSLSAGQSNSVLGTVRPDGVYQEGISAIGEWPPGRTGAALLEGGLFETLATTSIANGDFAAIFGGSPSFGTAQTWGESPLTPGALTTGTLAVLEDDPSAALFATGNGQGELLFGLLLHGFNRQSLLVRAGGVGPDFWVDQAQPLGCTSGIPSADAVSIPGGYAVVASSGGSVPNPCLIDGPAGAPGTLSLAFVDDNGTTERLRWDATASIRTVHVARAKTGRLFAAYGLEIPGSAIWSTSVSPEMDSSTEPTEISSLAADSFALTPLGDGVVLSWVTSTSTFEARFIDTSGQVTATLSEPLRSAQPAGRTLGVAAPDASSALVAWTQLTGQRQSVLATRVRCVP
ncbi:MAG: hypothetical protein HOW73_40915 [Polyangiaceae bacterium]|nr:hypothetical protein [Polyangiaceae bacterium]